jgi:hypothetical protein
LLVLGENADLQEPVDEHAKPRIGGDAPGAGMRGKEQAEGFQIRHHIADRGGGQIDAEMAREIARAHGLARLQIGFHDPAENLAGAVVYVPDGHHREPAFLRNGPRKRRKALI